MALTHTVCGTTVYRHCLKKPDGTDYYGTAHYCYQCFSTVLPGEITGTADGSTNIYGMSFPASLGSAGQPLTSQGAAVAPSFATLTGGFQYFDTKIDAVLGNINSQQTLLNFSNIIPAGAMNVLKRRLFVSARGSFQTALAQTPTLTFDCFIAAASRAQVVSGALTASLTDIPFEFDFEFQTNLIGAFGQFNRSAKLTISLNNVIFTTYITSPVTSTLGFDLTGVITPIITVTPSSMLQQIVINHAVTYVM